MNVDVVEPLRSERVGTEAPKAWSLSPLKYFHTQQEPWLFVWPELVQAAGDASAGLLLADIVRWSRQADEERLIVRKDKRVEVNGKLWVVKPQAALTMETGLTDSQVKRALARLRARALIERIGRQELLRPTRDFSAPNDRGIKVLTRMVHLTNSAARGIVLSQMHYWFSAGKDQKARVTQRFEGEWWWAVRYEELAAQTGLSVREARSAVQNLKHRGLIHSTVRRFAGRNTLHLRFDGPQFMLAWMDHHSTWMKLQADRRYQGHGEL